MSWNAHGSLLPLWTKRACCNHHVHLVFPLVLPICADRLCRELRAKRDRHEHDMQQLDQARQLSVFSNGECKWQRVAARSSGSGDGLNPRCGDGVCLCQPWTCSLLARCKQG